MLAIINALDSSTLTADIISELHIATWYRWWTIALVFALLSFGLTANREYSTGIFGGVASISIIVLWISGENPIIAEVATTLTVLYLVFLSLKAILRSWNLR